LKLKRRKQIQLQLKSLLNRNLAIRNQMIRQDPIVLADHPDRIEALHIVRGTTQNLNTDLIVTEVVAVEERMTKKRTDRKMTK